MRSSVERSIIPSALVSTGSPGPLLGQPPFIAGDWAPCVACGQGSQQELCGRYIEVYVVVRGGCGVQYDTQNVYTPSKHTQLCRMCASAAP